MERPPVHVVKLGGSLLDLPDLPARFMAWLATSAPGPRALVVGGGDAADCVRRWDALHRLDESHGHRLAVRAMQLNAHLLASRLTGFRFVATPDDCAAAWQQGDLALVDPLAWLEEEERTGLYIPHRWTFTSDSIAAHIAARLNASRLTVLKSVTPARQADVAAVVAAGILDADFPLASRGIPRIDLVNLRHSPPQACAIRSAV